ncbi:MAG: MFS transporter [Acidiferrobacteraceae bacterium]|nr:MFS transporter [Acidiferrobacteraceae bacterium]
MLHKLSTPLDFWRLACADLIVRTSYQVGKTPLMPLFAASLGGSELLVAAIVSVSTITGAALKPIFGWLSDYWGRRFWLFLGIIIFSITPFLYQLIESPEQLFVLRLFHGLATAIFGPVTLAVVSEMTIHGRAERLGWFGIGRSFSYLVAPILGAWLITWMKIEFVFTFIGVASCLAFVPVCMMDSIRLGSKNNSIKRLSILAFARQNFSVVIPNFSLWLAALLETLVYFFTYSIKIFLPLYAMQSGEFSLITIGFFFTIQEIAHLMGRPIGGKFADCAGYLRSVNIGYLFIVIGLFTLPNVVSDAGLFLVASVIGVGQGFVLPATTAFATKHLTTNCLGSGMGMLGAVRNVGKIAGPLVTGLLLVHFSYSDVFYLTATIAFIIFVSCCMLQRNFLKVMVSTSKFTQENEKQAILR